MSDELPRLHRVFDEVRARESEEDRERGWARQARAILCGEDRTSWLHSFDRHAFSTVVLHGRRDPLVPLGHGEALVEAVPGARIVVYDDMVRSRGEVGGEVVCVGWFAWGWGMGGDGRGWRYIET
jgi:pimeloyl-ACP methyl ester carboxylesterase